MFPRPQVVYFRHLHRRRQSGFDGELWWRHHIVVAHSRQNLLPSVASSFQPLRHFNEFFFLVSRQPCPAPHHFAPG